MNIEDTREAQNNGIFTKLRENLQELEKKNSDEFNWDNWQRQSIFYTNEIFQVFYGIILLEFKGEKRANVIRRSNKKNTNFRIRE